MQITGRLLPFVTVICKGTKGSQTLRGETYRCGTALASMGDIISDIYWWRLITAAPKRCITNTNFSFLVILRSHPVMFLAVCFDFIPVSFFKVFLPLFLSEYTDIHELWQIYNNDKYINMRWHFRAHRGNWVYFSSFLLHDDETC